MRNVSRIRKNILIEERSEDLFSTPTFLKFIATAIAGGSIALHFLGHISHETYLTQFGLDAEIFPKSIYWNEVHGYYAFFERGTTITIAFFENVGKQWKAFLAITIVLSAYLFAALMASKLIEANKTKTWTVKFPQWIKALILSVSVSFGIFSAIPIAMLAIMIFWALPGLIAESYGKVAAQKDFSAFIKGCDTPEKGYSCFELIKDKTIIAKGFLIDSSDSHIAFFDANTKHAQIFERKGTEFVVISSSKFQVQPQHK